MTAAEALIILSNVDGVLDGSPDDPTTKVVPEINFSDQSWQNKITPSSSSFGRGGMYTKLRMAQKAARLGITTYIANGKKTGTLQKILSGEKTGTCFPAQKRLSTLKTWLAQHPQEQKGAVFINAGAAAALRNSISSLLPIGIVRIEGDFEKGEMIKILSESGESIGYGIAQYNAANAQALIGQKGNKPLVHYDFLVVE